ncbi:MAG: hypothetical protein ABI906_07300 [Pseudomonadota bacterium]
MTRRRTQARAAIGAILLLALATPALGGGGGHHGHGRHSQGYIGGAPFAPGAAPALGTPGVAVPAAAGALAAAAPVAAGAPGASGAPGVKGAAVPAPAAVVPPPADDPVACEHPASAEQERLCLQRRTAEAAERGAIWAERTYFIGLGILGLILAIVLAYFVRRGRRSPGA